MLEFLLVNNVIEYKITSLILLSVRYKMEIRRISLLGLFLANYIILGRAEVFTAIDDMKDLIYVEAAVIVKMKSYIVDQENKLTFLRRRVIDYEKLHAEAAKNISWYLSNPVNAFLITKRLTHDLEDLTHRIVEGTTDEIFQNLEDENGNDLVLPTNEDLKGAAAAITRIQDTYDLDAQSIANGKFRSGMLESPNLTAADCYEIAYQAYNSSEFKLCIPWLQLAMERLEDGSLPETTASIIDLMGYYAFALNSVGNYTESLRTVEKLLEFNPDDEVVLKNKKILEETLASKKDKVQTIRIVPVEERTSDPTWITNYGRSQQEIYKRLCRREIVPSPMQLAPLRCRYVTNKSPFLRIAPFKLEEISLDPYIVAYHDVIYDREIELIKELAIPKLERAAVDDDNGTVISGDDIKYRISKAAWLADDDHKYIEDISFRVQDMTGLTMTHAEDLQIVNYGIGGHYEPHFDFALEGDTTYETQGGNRIATILFYLSDVAEGGATVFPIIDIALWPKKGSAAFWYNLYESGHGDIRTKHAGCPVFIGSKWVANKWLHLKDQELSRPCKLYPDHPEEDGK